MEGSPIVVDHTLSAVRQLNVITYASSSEQSVKPLSCTIINNIEPSVSIVFDSSTLKEAKKNEQINYFSDNPNLCVSEKTPGNSSVTNKSNASFSIVNSKNIFVKKNDLDLLSFSRNEGCQVKLSQSAKTFNLIAFSSSADYNSKISKSSSRTSVNGKPLTFSVVSNNNDSKVSLLSNKANYSTSLNFVKNKVSTPNKFTVTSNVKKKMSTQLTSESLCLNLPPLKSTVAVTPNALSISNFSGKYSEINHSEIKSNILKNKICDGKGTTTVFSEQKKIVYGKLSVITTPNSEGGNKKKLIFLPTQSSDSNFSKQFSLNLIAKPINTQTSQFVCKAPPATQKSPIGITSTTPQNSMICKTSPAPQKLPIMVSSPLTKNLSNLNVIEDNKSHLKVEHSNNIKLSASRVSNSIERSLVNEPKDGKGVSSSSSNCGILQTFILNMPRSKFGLKFGVHCSSPTTVITTTSLNTYNAKNEKSNIYSPTVSHSNEKSNTILITKCKTQDTFKNIKKTLIVTDPLKLDQISKEKRLFKKKQDILKVKAVPTALSVSNVTSVSSVPCVSSVSNIPILKNISSIEINSQCNSIFNHNSNLLEVQTSHNITPSSSTTYLKNKVLFRKRKSNVELKDSPTSLSKISRTFFALDRLYRCKSLWINDGEKCIAYLRELRDLLVVERARQQKFLDSMMQLNIERLKKNSTQKPEKKKQTPAEKLIDKLSLKINQTPAEKLIDKLCLNIKVSETSKISKPIVKIKTFSDIQKEQEKQKHLSKYHMDQIAENEKKNNEVAVTLTDYSINSQSYVTCKRKLSDDPEVFKKFKYSKVILDSSQSTEYSNEIVASENDANMLNNQNEVSTLHVTQNQDYLLNEDENSPKQHIFISKIEKIENLSKTNVYVPEEKENIPETHSYLFKDNENELEYIALNKNEALPNLHIDSAVDKSLTSSKLELSLDIIKNENKFSNSNIVTINDDYKTSSESISKNEDNKLSLESINKNEDKKINLENITKSEDDKTNLEDLAKNEDNKSNLEGIAKNEDNKTNLESITRNKDNKVNLDSVTRNEEKNQKLLHTLKIKSPHEIHEKLKLVKQKTSLRTRSCRPNPKDPFISKEYGALQQAIALSLKSEQGNITEAQFKDSSSFKTACKKVTKRKRCREVDQLTDAHWNESWLRGSCSPTYSNQRLGREERSLHWAMSKFAEMDNKESTKQTSKDNPIPTGKTKKTSTNENSFKRETCEKENERIINDDHHSLLKTSVLRKKISNTGNSGVVPGKVEAHDFKITHMNDLKYPRVHLEKHRSVTNYAQAHLKKYTNNVKYTRVQSKNHANSDMNPTVQIKEHSNISSRREGLRKNTNDLKILVEKQNVAFLTSHYSTEKKILYNVNRSTGETILHKAARLGYCNVVEESIRSGVDVNVKDYAGWSPLHEACAYSQVGVSEILLKYGADSNSSSKNGMRPIYDALERQDFPMIRLLLSYGADISLLKSANCKSDVLKYLTAHQIDREKNCNSTMKENDEGSWKFAGTCSFLDNNECVGIFEDIPIEENLANIDFEISSRPMPLSFYLPYRNESGDILGYRNYFILSEFLNGANLTKSVLLKHSSKDVIKMTITELADLTKKYSVSKPTDDLSCDKNGFVELVYISPNKLQKILKSKVVKIPAMIL